MKQKTLIIIATIISLILICIKTVDNYTFMLNINWHIGIPQPDKIIYMKDLGPSFNGDGTTYSVYSYNSIRKIKKLKELKWTGYNNLELENRINKSFLLKQLNIDSQYMINFNDDYLYYVQQRKNQTEVLCIIYMYNQGKIYIIEDIS